VPAEATAALEEAQRLSATGRFQAALDAAKRCEAALASAAAPAPAPTEPIKPVEPAAPVAPPAPLAPPAPAEPVTPPAPAAPSEAALLLAGQVRDARVRGTAELVHILESGGGKLVALAASEANRRIQQVTAAASGVENVSEHLAVASVYCSAAARRSGVAEARAADAILERVAGWLESSGRVPEAWVICGDVQTLAGLPSAQLGGVSCAGTFTREEARQRAGGGAEARAVRELLGR